MEKQNVLHNTPDTYSIKVSTYIRFIHCVLNKCNESDIKTNLETFCEKYDISNSDEILKLLNTIKESNTHNNILENDIQVISNLLFFIIYYMKQDNNLFTYMNLMLILMRVTLNMSSHIDNGTDINAQCDKIIKGFDRIDLLMKLTKHIQTITENMSNDVNYTINASIEKIYDSNYLNFQIIESNKRRRMDDNESKHNGYLLI